MHIHYYFMDIHLLNCGYPYVLSGSISDTYHIYLVVTLMTWPLNYIICNLDINYFVFCIILNVFVFVLLLQKDLVLLSIIGLRGQFNLDIDLEFYLSVVIITTLNHQGPFPCGNILEVPKIYAPLTYFGVKFHSKFIRVMSLLHKNIQHSWEIICIQPH